MRRTAPKTAHAPEVASPAGRQELAWDGPDSRSLHGGPPTGNAWVRAAGVAGALARFTAPPGAEPRVPRPAAGADHSRRRDAALVLSRALEARDPFTYRHSHRVGDLAVRLAGELGWPPGHAGLLHEAALMHDIGKIVVPDAILFAPGPLGDEEWEVVKRHPSDGADILAGMLTADQTSWVRGHHERWDGRGYPDRLARDAIPPGAQILTLADSFDAMTSTRVYRAGMAVTDAIDECRGQRGRQFAPRVVDALLRLDRRGGLFGTAWPAAGGRVPAPVASASG